MALQDTECEKTSVLALPNEVHTAIIRELDSKDRYNLSKVNDRFRGLEKVAGYRQFKMIYLYGDATCYTCDTHSHVFDRNFNSNTTLDELTSFFHYGTTDYMKITGEFRASSETMIRTVLNTIRIGELRLSIYNEMDLSIFNYLHKRKSIKDMCIELYLSGKDFNSIKRMLLELPKKEKIEIEISASREQAEHAKNIIDDEMLIHLASISSKVNITGSQATSISACGLAKAFEIVRSDQYAREIDVDVTQKQFHLFRSRLDFSEFDRTFEFHGRKETLKHRQTGVTMRFCPVQIGHIIVVNWKSFQDPNNKTD